MQATEFVTSYIDAWNRQDSRAVADHLAENGTYLDMPDQGHMSPQQLIDHLEELFQQESYIYELTGEVLSGQNSIAFQYKVIPREPGGDSEEAQTWYGAEFITLHNGVAEEIADYYEHQSSEAPQSPVATATSGRQVQRYAKSGLNAQQLDHVKGSLQSLMEDNKAYLRSDLTLPDLAESLDCSINHVSQAINAGFGMSFFDYLNQYRIKEAMRLMSTDEEEASTVLRVALEVGFNSTSTFYVAFKKVTGKTPAQYRRAQIQTD
jgi:AraC-like DNA-binding protein